MLKSDYDQRCDVWSLGIIAYMLLSGAPPFNADTSDKIHALILSQEPDFSVKAFPKAGPVTIDFLRLILNKDPLARLTIDEAFAHPFIQTALEGNPRRLPASAPSSPRSMLTPATPRVEDPIACVSKYFHMSRARQYMVAAVSVALMPPQVGPYLAPI